jgi:hypothetical protein
MNQPNFVELARNGDLHAISVLITQALKSQKIAARASSRGSQLQVLLEAETFPKQDALVKYICQGITKLNLPLYKTLVIYGKRLNEDKPDWKQEFSLVPQDKSSSSKPAEAKSVPEDLLPNDSASDLPKVITVKQKLQPHQRENTDKRLDKQLPENSIQKNTFESLEKLVRSVKSFKRAKLIVCVLLWVGICFDSLFLLYSLVWAMSDGLYTLLRIADTPGIFSSLIYRIVQFMYEFWDAFEQTDRLIYRLCGFGLVIWLYFLHRVLKWTFKSYPIRPWGAVARYAIPLYKIWGIWNIFSTLANHLINDQEEAITHQGRVLKRWIPRLYVGIVLSILVGITSIILSVNVDETDHISWWFYVVSNAISLGCSVLYLQVVRISHRAVSEKAHYLIHPPHSLQSL